MTEPSSPNPPSKPDDLPPPSLSPPLETTTSKSHNQTLPIGAASLEPQLKSFRDTLIDGDASRTPPLVTLEELIAAKGLMETNMSMADDGHCTGAVKIPKVRIPKAIWQRLCTLFQNAIIVKLLGKSVHFHVLQVRLQKEWHTEWHTEYEYDFIDIVLGYYIVKFGSSKDRLNVLTGGPYKIFDHYLIVQPWEPSFQLAGAKAPKTAVWVKLYGVPAMCYYEAVVLYVARKLGNPIKVDRVTLMATRGKFARVCVEIDLRKKLPSSIDLDLEEWPQSLVLVEYEGLHKICFHCGEYGHKEDSCGFKNPPIAESKDPVAIDVSNKDQAKAIVALSQTLKPETEENNMVYGSWMIAKRKPRKNNQTKNMARNHNTDTTTRQENM
ncbi:hypothetical protein SLA2020_207950 [Shorea laevis]